MSTQRSRFSARALVFALTAACFFALGIVVYRDDPEGDASAFTTLSPSGRNGFMHWRAQNCVVCHQIYGFGGYLGPDLTHVAQRVDAPTFLDILKKGTGPMPGVRMEDAAGKELYTFLREMDRSGQGHPAPSATPLSWSDTFEVVRSESTAPGIEIFTKFECARCHQPLRVGQFGSPDLTRAWERNSLVGLRVLLRAGRGSMPTFAMSGADAAKVAELLRALNEHRAELLSRQRESRGPLPWWNYQSRSRTSEPDQPAGGAHGTQ